MWIHVYACMKMYSLSPLIFCTFCDSRHPMSLRHPVSLFSLKRGKRDLRKSFAKCHWRSCTALQCHWRSLHSFAKCHWRCAHFAQLFAKLEAIARRSLLPRFSEKRLTGWRSLIGCLLSQAIFRKRATNYSAKEPLIIGLFCGEWPIHIRHPMGVRRPVRALALRFDFDFRIVGLFFHVSVKRDVQTLALRFDF